MNPDEIVAQLAVWLAGVRSSPGDAIEPTAAEADFVPGVSPFFVAAPDVLHRAAFHESAHAVAAHRCGFTILKAVVYHYGRGNVAYQNTGDGHIDKFAGALAALASVVCECALGVDFGQAYRLRNSGDLRVARSLIDSLELPADQLGNRYETIARIAVATVASNWQAIERVAAALLRAPLTGKEVAAICDASVSA